MTTKRMAAATFFAALLGSTALAQDVNLMAGVEPRPEGNSVVEAGAFQSDAPWTIAMSHFGVNANTWTVQTAHEAQGIADADDRIENFIMLDANFDQAKLFSANGIVHIVARPANMRRCAKVSGQIIAP